MATNKVSKTFPAMVVKRARAAGSGMLISYRGRVYSTSDVLRAVFA